MPYKSVRCNFSMGESAPALEGRADTDFYQKTARRMRDVAIDAFGGFRRRPGTLLQCEADASLVSDLYTETTFNTSIEASEEGSLLLELTHVPEACQAVSHSWVYGHTLYDSYRVYQDGISANAENSGTIYAAYSTKKVPDEGTELFTGQSCEISLGAIRKIQITEICKVQGFKVTLTSGSGKYTKYYWMRLEYVLDSGLTLGILYKSTRQPPRQWASAGQKKATIIPQTRVGTGTPSSLVIKDFQLYSARNGETEAQADIYAIWHHYPDESDYMANEYATLVDTITLNVGETYPTLSIPLKGLRANRIQVRLRNFSGQAGHGGALATSKATEAPAYRLIPFVISSRAAYMIAIKPGYMTIYRDGRETQTLEAPFLTAENAMEAKYAQNAGTMIFTHRSFQPYQLQAGSNDSSWTLTPIEFEMPYALDGDKENWRSLESTVGTSALDGPVKLTFSTVMDTDLTGQYFEGGGARVKITRHTPGTSTAEGFTVWGFYSTDQIESGTRRITTNYKPAWSGQRGWPSAVTFYQGRMWLAGTTAQPQTVWGSRSGLYYRFMPSDSGDSDAIEYTLDTDSLSRITALYPMGGLYILTEGGIFLTAASYDQPLTPSTVNAKRLSSIGANTNISPIDVDGRITFVEGNNNAIMTLLAGNGDAAVPANLSLISSHIIRSPQDMDAEHNNPATQCNYLYITNGDGTLTVCNMLAEQNINGGFTLWDFGGRCLSVCVIPGGTYLLMERNGHQTIEKLDWDSRADCLLTLEEQEEETDYMHPLIAPAELNAAPIAADIYQDGQYRTTVKLDSGGMIHLDEGLTGTVQIGRAYRPYVESHPLEIPQLAQGMGRRKRIAGFTARVLDTPSLVINGMERTGTGQGVEDLEYSANAGWGKAETYSITQNDGRPMHVLACQITANFEVSGDEY